MTAFGPNQASYSMTTIWLLLSTMKGREAKEEAATAEEARNMPRASKIAFDARAIRGIRIGNPNPKEKFRARWTRISGPPNASRWERGRSPAPHPLEWQLASLHGQNLSPCPALWSAPGCLLSPAADMPPRGPSAATQKLPPASSACTEIRCSVVGELPAGPAVVPPINGSVGAVGERAFRNSI